MKKEKIMIAGDFHIPFEDEKTISKLLLDIKKNKPDVLILNGDIVDFYQLSRFSKNPTRILSFQQDLDIAKILLTTIRKYMGNKRIIYIQGNHEFRLISYLKDNPSLFTLEALDIVNLLKLNELNIEYVSTDSKNAYITYLGINIGHFDTVRKYAGMTALGMLVEKSGSYIQGHTHRLGVLFRRTDKGTLVAGESGCMCKLNPDYSFKPDWQHGYLLIEKTEGEQLQVTPVFLN